jgi:hypothetical protein
VQEVDLLLKFKVKGMRYFISTFNLDSGPDSCTIPIRVLLCVPLTEHVARDGTLYDCTLRTVPDNRWYN